MAGIVIDTGTVAAAGFDELKLNVTFEGAGTESVSDRFCEAAPAVRVRLEGKKLADPVTCTVVLAEP